MKTFGVKDLENLAKNIAKKSVKQVGFPIDDKLYKKYVDRKIADFKKEFYSNN